MDLEGALTMFEDCGYPSVDTALSYPADVYNCLDAHISTKCWKDYLDEIAEVCQKKHGPRVYAALYQCRIRAAVWGTDKIVNPYGVDAFWKSLPLNGGMEALGGVQCVAPAVLRYRSGWGGGEDHDSWKLPYEYSNGVPQ